MAFGKRWRRGGSRGGAASRETVRADEKYLGEFVASRRGVEAFVEPATAFSEATLVLVAADGEWTRRRTGDEQAAFVLGRKLGIPVYDVAAVGYPPRMREWSARRAAEQRGATGEEPS